jgi:hypothetical protein
VWSESDQPAPQLARAPIVAGSRIVTALPLSSDARPAPDCAERALEIVLGREA